MREILFRGKTFITKKMVTGTGILYDGTNTWIVNNEPPKALAFGMERYTVIPETIGQYTGLTNKNGTKIFEGDICQIKGISYIDETPFVVEWNEEYSGWFWRNLDFSSATDTITPEIAKTSRIIGNIHDNPELLKEREG